MKRFSIIIPFYNQSSILQETVASVICNLTDNDEAIFVDDCSSDSTYLELIKITQNVRNITVLKNCLNLGHIATMNRAIEHSTGNYLVFLGGDDLIGTEFLTDTYRSYRSTNIDALFSPVCFFSDTENLDLNTRKEQHFASKRTLSKFQACIGWGKFKQEKYSIIGFSIKKSVMLTVNNFDENILVEDHDLFIRLCQKGFKLGFRKGVFSFYRQVPNSISSKSLKMIKADCKVLWKNTNLLIFSICFLKRLLVHAKSKIKAQL